MEVSLSNGRNLTGLFQWLQNHSSNRGWVHSEGIPEPSSVWQGADGREVSGEGLPISVTIQCLVREMIICPKLNNGMLVIMTPILCQASYRCMCSGSPTELFLWWRWGTDPSPLARKVTWVQAEASQTPSWPSYSTQWKLSAPAVRQTHRGGLCRVPVCKPSS